MRILFPLIGYISFATVLTAAFGYGYLRQTETLDDERMLKIIALLHDVDLDAIENRDQQVESVVPDEEMSYEQQQQQLRIATLQFDAKQKELEDSLVEFGVRFKELDSRMGRYNTLSTEVQKYLNEQREALNSAAIQKVRASIVTLIADKQAKPLLKRMISDDIDQVILILSGMSKRNQQTIMRTFVNNEEDIEILYRLHEKMLNGGSTKQLIDEKLKDLKKLNRDAQ